MNRRDTFDILEYLFLFASVVGTIASYIIVQQGDLAAAPIAIIFGTAPLTVALLLNFYNRRRDDRIMLDRSRAQMTGLETDLPKLDEKIEQIDTKIDSITTKLHEQIQSLRQPQSDTAESAPAFDPTVLQAELQQLKSQVDIPTNDLNFLLSQVEQLANRVELLQRDRGSAEMPETPRATVTEIGNVAAETATDGIAIESEPISTVRDSRTREMDVDLPLKSNGSPVESAPAIEGETQAAIAGSEILGRYDAGERDFSELNLAATNLEQACLPEVDLARADLRRTDLTKADLSRSDLSHANLCEANLYGANLQMTNLGSTDFSHANLEGADLDRANLSMANLQSAKLANARLSGTDMHDVDLQNADLQNADLSYADLTLANLTGANIEGANLHRARFEGTTMPDSSVRG